MVRLILFLVIFNNFFLCLARDKPCLEYESKLVYWHDRHCRKYHFVKDFIKDMANISLHVFSPKSLGAASFLVPVWAASKDVDDEVHNCFYDDKAHQNLKSLPRCVSTAVSASATALAVLCGSIQLFTSDPVLKLTSDIFTKGALSIWFFKNAIKNSVELKICERPPNGDFKRCIYYGGFPSGHMAISTYLAAFFWKRQGPLWGIPLSLCAVANFGISLNHNRHYLSQLVAGAAIGVLFTCASCQVLSSKVKSHLSCCPTFSGKRVGLKVGYSF